MGKVNTPARRPVTGLAVGMVSADGGLSSEAEDACGLTVAAFPRGLCCDLVC